MCVCVLGESRWASNRKHTHSRHARNVCGPLLFVSLQRALCEDQSALRPLKTPRRRRKKTGCCEFYHKKKKHIKVCAQVGPCFPCHITVWFNVLKLPVTHLCFSPSSHQLKKQRVWCERVGGDYKVSYFKVFFVCSYSVSSADIVVFYWS